MLATRNFKRPFKTMQASIDSTNTPGLQIESGDYTMAAKPN
jgi:hypothetical protein